MPNHYNMKKYFLILALALIGVSASAQKVTLNERNEQGIRFIETDLRAFYVDHDMHMCQLSYLEQNGNGVYVLMFGISEQSNRWTAKAGQKILLKAADGQIIEVLAGGSSHCQLGRSTRGRGAVYMVSLPYFLTQEQAEIITKGLVKVRIEYTYEDIGSKGLMDIEIPADLTAYLKKAIKNIDKTIPMPVSVDKSVF
jgi:hypothetical protein